MLFSVCPHVLSHCAISLYALVLKDGSLLTCSTQLCKKTDSHAAHEVTHVQHIACHT